MLHQYYYPAIAKMHKKLHAAAPDPFANNILWLGLQEDLLRLTIKVESKILHNKALKKQLKAELGNASQKLTKEVAKLKKRKIASIESKIEQYHQLLAIFKSIGDAIAFVFIDRFDLKAMSFKPTPGFLINKKGARLERKCFRAAYKMGGIAILNDLTNTLKHGDLTLVSNFRSPALIEIKSGRNRNLREERQRVSMEKLSNFLTFDTPSDVLKEGMISHRMAITEPLKDHLTKLNALIVDAKQKRMVGEEVENGLVYIITYGDVEDDLIGAVFGKTKLSKPLPFAFNQFKYNHFGFYPACLSFLNTQHYIDYLAGNMQVFILWDINSWDQELAIHDLKLREENEMDNMMFRITGQLDGQEFIIGVGEYMVNRMLFEFLSPAWYINDLIHMIGKIPHLINEGTLNESPLANENANADISWTRKTNP